MRTTIELDDDLVREDQALSGISDKQALVHQALRELVLRLKGLDLRDLEGCDLIDPDYKALRSGAN